VRVFRRQVPGTGYPVSGTGYLAPGTWYPAPEPNQRRGPDSEHRRPSPATGKRAHRVCLVYPTGQYGSAGNDYDSSLVARHFITSSLRHFYYGDR
jgi:hypothetical protein